MAKPLISGLFPSEIHFSLLPKLMDWEEFSRILSIPHAVSDSIAPGRDAICRRLGLTHMRVCNVHEWPWRGENVLGDEDE